jgi:N-methylhydantoinase B
MFDDDDGAVDEPGTAVRRAELRRGRLGGAEPSRPPPDGPADGAVGGVLVRDADGRWRCRCGFDLGPVDGNFKDRARTRVVAPGEHGPRIRLHEELELREHCCPACATLLESEVARRDQPSRATITLAR